jgi:hypothetical protein
MREDHVGRQPRTLAVHYPLGRVFKAVGGPVPFWKLRWNFHRERIWPTFRNLPSVRVGFKYPVLHRAQDGDYRPDAFQQGHSIIIPALGQLRWGGAA